MYRAVRASLSWPLLVVALLWACGEPAQEVQVVDASVSGSADAEPADPPDARPQGQADARPTPDATPLADAPLPACLNESDQAIPFEEIDAAANSCGNECMFDGTPNCVRDCMVETVGLTEGCAACYDAMVACMVGNCALQCLDESSAACEQCRLENCATPFTECSGLEG